jgi:putative transcriptional regulator
MTGTSNLAGSILVSQPKCEDPYFSKSVIIIGKHGPQGAWGLMTNKITNSITLDQVMKSVGIMSNKQDKVYIGGPVDTNRVHILHSIDWMASSTIQISPEIGITSDISVLAAISQDQGPALYRACIGMSGWGPGQLDGELRGEHPWKTSNRWLDAPATIESVFHLHDDEQWQQCIDIVAKNKISNWL